MTNVNKVTKLTKADGHGPQFDRFSRQASHPHGGSYYDEGFRKPQPDTAHGPQADAGYRGNAGDQFEREWSAVPAAVRKLSAGCPSCGHTHTLEDALRTGRGATTGKSGRPDIIDLRKADDGAVRADVGEPESLHDALVANVYKTYGGGIDGAAGFRGLAVQKTRGRRA